MWQAGAKRKTSETQKSFIRSLQIWRKCDEAWLCSGLSTVHKICTVPNAISKGTVHTMLTGLGHWPKNVNSDQWNSGGAVHILWMWTTQHKALIVSPDGFQHSFRRCCRLYIGRRVMGYAWAYCSAIFFSFLFTQSTYAIQKLGIIHRIFHYRWGLPWTPQDLGLEPLCYGKVLPGATDYHFFHPWFKFYRFWLALSLKIDFKILIFCPIT